MRTTHTLTVARALFISSALLIVAGLVFAFAPMRPVAAARQALAARVNANPTANKILSIAPAPVRSAIQKRLAAPVLKATSAAAASTALMFDTGIALEADPPSGSFVGQQQPLNIIAYTIQASNDNSTDTEGGGNDITITMNAPNGTLFQNLQITQQPQFGSAWSCPGFVAGASTFTCSPNGAAAGTWTLQEFVKIRVEAAVQAGTPTGSLLVARATYTQTVGTAQTTNTNETQHVVNPFADLAITKFAQTSQPPGPDPQNGVLAGGPTATLTSANTGGELAGNITYALSVRNEGPANANNVRIEDSVPGGPAELVNNAIPAISPPGDPIAGPDPTAPAGTPFIPDFATVTTVTINTGGNPNPAQFRLNCSGFGIGSTFTCTPANNTHISAAYLDGVLPRFFRARIAYRLKVSASATPGSFVSNSARIFSVGNSGPSPSAGSSATPDPNTANNTSLTTQNVVYAKADLGITKTTGNPTPVNGGAAFAYTIIVTNAGPSNAANVVVTDPLPAGIVLANNNIAVAAAPAGSSAFACTGPAIGQNGTITCTSGNMNPGATATITLVVQAIANQAGGVRRNQASVASATPETTPNTLPNASNNAPGNPAEINLQVVAPLNFENNDQPDPVCAGGNLVYHFFVQNVGQSNAINANLVTQVLPPGMTFVSVVGTNGYAGKCTYDGLLNQVFCDQNISLAPGVHDVNLTVKLASNFPVGPLNFLATLAPGTGTNNIPANGQATATTTVLHCADLEITKDDSPDAVLAGQDINYTINVKNVGPSDLAAGEIRVNDTFVPVGTTLKAGTAIIAPGFDCNGTASAAVCNSTTPLPAGASLQIKFTVTVNANFNGGQPGGFVVNTATGSLIAGGAAVACPPDPGAQVGNLRDPNCANNTSTVNTPVGPSADLSVLKQAFTLNGSNFDAQVTAGGAISAVPPALPAPIVTGPGEIFYGLTYRNSGLGDAVNVHIRDVIPAGAQFVAGSIVVNAIAGPALNCNVSPLPTQLDCTPAGGGTLPAGANGTISFRTRVLANVAEGTAIRNTATINSEGVGATPATPDPNGGNNSSSTQNRVRAQVDLSVVKTDAPDPVVAGTNITYTLTVTNNSIGGAPGSDAQNVVVKDTLPPNVSFVSTAPGSDPRFTCLPDNGNPGVVNCTAATLIANDPNIQPPRSGGNVATIIIIGKVSASAPAGACPGVNCLTNTATVTSSTNEDAGQLANNTATATTAVGTDAAVTIVKTDNPDPVVAGTNLTYTITVNNNGPSDAQAVSVVDTLPPATQVQFLSATGTGVFSAANSCTQAANVVTCNAIPVGVFPAGATANITIVVRVLPSVPANPLPHTPDNPAGLLNTATINWTDTNGVPGAAVAQAATDTERTTVRHESDMAIKKEAPDFAIAGSRYDIRLTVANNGPSDVLGDAALPGSIVVWDLLPAGTSVAAVVPNPIIQPGGPGNFQCRVTASGGRPLVLCYNAADAAGNFPAGARIDIIIKVDTNSNLPDGSNLYNCAEVTLRNTDNTPEIDPNGGGQHDNTNPAVGIPGISAPPPAPAGALTNASGNNESCDSTVVRGSADLAIGKSAVPVVDPDGAGPLPAVPLPIVGPNVPPGSVNAGGYVRYDVPFGNNGPSDAINVLLSDQIAGNTAFVGALATGGVFVPAAQPPAVPFTFTIQATDTVAPLGPNVNLTCTVFQAAGSQSIYCRPQGNGALPAPGPYADGTLPAGYNGTLTFFVKVNESVSGGTIVSNPANITSGLCPNAVAPTFPPSACAGTGDPNTANNTTLPTQTAVVASSNLAVSKIVQSAVTTASNPNQTGPIGPATAPNGVGLTGTAVLPGTLLTYRVTITNNGPSDVSNIRLTDVLPSGLETPPGRVLGAKFVSASPVVPSGATFTCAAPTGVNPGNNPQSNGGSIVCTAPLLSANAPNNVAAIDITVFIDPATKANLVDTATVDATLNNFNRPVSGTAVLTTPVAATSDLALTKTHTNAAGVVGGPVTAGTVFTYTVTLTNNGPSAAQMVSLVDTLPTFQQVRSIQIQQVPDGNGAPNFTCAATPAIGLPTGTGNNTTSVTCTAAELPPNKNANGTVNPSGTVTFILTVRQDEATVQPLPVNYQNCVTATSMSTDPNPANNTNVCDTIPIIFLANPTGTKTDTPDPVIAGNLLTYTIVGTNPGPSAALNFRIVDPLPQGTVFISQSTSSANPVHPVPAVVVAPAVGAPGTVTATWPGLTLPGATRTLTIVVRVCPDFQQILGLTDAQMCVPNLTNTATITSDTPGVAGTATSTTTVQAQSDLGIAKAGPASAIANTIVTYTLTVTNAGPSNANGVVVTDVLPKGFTLVPNGVSIAAGDINGDGVVTPADGAVNAANSATATDAAGTQTVTINLGVVGAANQCTVPGRARIVVITLRARVPTKHPNIIVTNSATVSSTNCLPETGTLAVQANPFLGFASIITPGTGMLGGVGGFLPNRAFFDTIIGPPSNDPGPGSVPGYPATAEISDQKAGSVLFYPIYTSDAANPNAQNTRMSITNISSAETACVHLYLVDGASCGVVDVFLCLTPNQTVAFTAADFDPGQTGYAVAVAVDCTTGLPIAFNCLIGDEFVKFSTGHAANLGAEAVAAVMFNPAGTDTTATTATIRFNGMNYNRLPRIVAVDSLQSRADQNDPLLIVNAVGGNFTRSGSTIVSLFGAVYDDAEIPYSFTQNVSTCQFRSIINNNFPRMITRLETAIPAGRSGWMKFWSTVDQGLVGAVINRNPNAGSNSGAFNQGHNLHKLTLTDQSSIVLPVLVPACN